MVNIFKKLRSKGQGSEKPPPVQRSDERPNPNTNPNPSASASTGAGTSRTVPQADKVKQPAAPHRAWYDFVEEETLRNPIPQGDRLDTISSVAQGFAQSLAGDAYAAGIWHNDLLTGLLWHSPDFEASDSDSDSISDSQKPTPTPLQNSTTSPRAPTWSWTNLTGTIRFLRPNTYNPSPTPPLLHNLESYTLHTTPNTPFAPVHLRNGSISLTCRMRDLTTLRGFDHSFATWLSQNRPTLAHDCTPDISMDPDYTHDCTKYVVPLVRKVCDPRCRHATGCDVDPMVYGLVLHFAGQGPTFDELPAVRVAREMGRGRIGEEVEVFMRCGVVACYSSSFERVKWQEAVIL